jgi:hypothetical protein
MMDAVERDGIFAYRDGFHRVPAQFGFECESVDNVPIADQEASPCHGDPLSSFVGCNVAFTLHFRHAQDLTCCFA